MGSRYLYVASAQKPTGVTHAVTGSITGQGHVNLVLAKTNHLELHAVTPGGLQPVYDVPINGRISTLQCVRLSNDKRDCIMLTTDLYQLVVLSYDPVDRILRTIANGDLRDRIERPTERGPLSVWDPQGRCAVLHFYDGLLKVVPTERGFREKAFNVRINELELLDACFLHGAGTPTLALLTRDPRGVTWVSTYEVNVAEQKLKPGPWRVGPHDPTACLLIPVPSPVKGVLIAGRGSLTYTNGRDTETVAAPTPLQPRGYSAMDSTRFLIADATGSLFAAALLLDEGGRGVAGLRYQRIGPCVPPSCVAYLDGSHAFVGSVYGDSQLVRLAPARNPATGSHVEVVASFTHLGPIVDFTVMDLDRQGQGQIVAACNAFSEGSLRVVRSGIGIQAQAVVELPAVRGIWSLTAPPPADAEAGASSSSSSAAAAVGDSEGPQHSHLVLAFPSETRVFAITGDAMEEAELGDGFLSEGVTTLFCCSLSGPAPGQAGLLQATPKEVRLSVHNAGGGTYDIAQAWTPPSGQRVTLASAAGTHVVLALTGGDLVYLRVSWPADAGSHPSLAAVGTRRMAHEVACVHVAEMPARVRAPPASSSAAMDTDEGVEGGSGSSSVSAGTVPLAAVGLWTDTTVHVLSLAAPSSSSSSSAAPLADLSVEVLGGQIQPRSVQLVDLEGTPFLLAALGDGHLFNFRLDVSTGGTSERKVVALGSQPIGLTQFTHKGASHVFASCDRPTVLFASPASRGSRGKVLYSNVNMGAVSAMAPFNSPAFPHCLALCSAEGLTLGPVDDIQKLHVHTVRLGETPRRVVHHRGSKSIVVAVESSRPAGSWRPEGPAASAAVAASSSSSSSSAPPPASEEPMVEASYLRLFDDATFESAPHEDGGVFELDPHEMVLALSTVKLAPPGAAPASGPASSSAGSAASSSSSAGGGGLAGATEYIVLGTAYILPDEEEPSRGRVVVLAVTTSGSSSSSGSGSAGGKRRFELIASKDVRGGVYATAPLGEDGQRIVATINSRVQVFRWATSSAAAATAAASSSGRGESSKAAAGKGASSSSAMAIDEESVTGAASGFGGEPGGFALVSECGFTGNVQAIYLDVRGDFIAVGDLMRSVSLLRYKRDSQSLEEVAGEPGINWMTAVALLDDSAILGAEGQYNLFTAIRNTGGATPDDRSRLEMTGSFHLGDQVNRFRPGTLAMLPADAAGAMMSEAAAMSGSAAAASSAGADDEPVGAGASSGGSHKRQRTDAYGVSSSSSSSSSSSALLAPVADVPRPRLLFATVSGAIGAVISLPKGMYRYLVRLQRAIGQVVHPVGGLSHRKYRAFKHERKQPYATGGGEEPGAVDFVDGDFVEQLLDMDRAAQEKVIGALNSAGSADAVSAGALHPDGSGESAGPASLDEALKAVEELSRLH